ncbi:MAG: hexose kinase [Clostridia bacterium]|nr:hexose kinase [Clostridia bacterium]
MLTTVLCFNPSNDRTVEVADFVLDATNRILAERIEGASKGVNVAVAASRLGIETACVGLLPRRGGEMIRERLARDGVRASFVRIPGAVRTNLKIRDRSRWAVTELNEPGVAVRDRSLAKARAQALRLAADSDYLVLTGSLPPGCPEDFYAKLIADAPLACRCVLDASGEVLARALHARPFLIKPNRQELERACGRELPALRDVRAAALSLIGAGARRVAVSLAEEGALLTDGAHVLFAPAVAVPVRSAAGAGDAMVAGMIAGFREGDELEHALRCGVAAAAASVASGRMAPCPATYERMLRAVKVSVI